MSRRDLAILVPVLARPQNVEPLLASIAQTTPPCRVLFICDPDDTDEINAVDATGTEKILVNGNYARKINQGISATSEPYLFIGADDLRFQPGWAQQAFCKLDPAQVIGVNDLIPRDREHTTHFLVSREYAEGGQIDGASGLLHEGYEHERVDDELIAVARKRGVYVYAENSHVQHLHPIVGTAPDDPTYEKGRQMRRIDRKRFLRRRHLWTLS